MTVRQLIDALGRVAAQSPEGVEADVYAILQDAGDTRKNWDEFYEFHPEPELADDGRGVLLYLGGR